MILYVIQVWDQSKRKYVDLWAGSEFDMAYKMLYKPYNRKSTRRLMKIETTQIEKVKGKR